MTANQLKVAAGLVAAGLAAVALILAMLQSGAAQPAPRTKTEKAATRTAPAERTADERSIRKSAETFVKAFNAGDAKGAAEQFLAQAEYLNSDGEAFEGRDEIQEDLAAFFKEYPKAKIELEIDSIRFVGPRVAIEEGRTAVTREPGQAPIRQSYMAVDILTDGEWQLASVREAADDDEPMTPHDHLEPLGWLVGDWVDESDSGVVTTSCRWTEDGNYLLQDFQLQIAGRRAITAQQRIGWDPLTGHVKSWVFDSEGGYSEGLWTQSGDQWIVKAQGVRPDGTVGTGTNIYTPRNQDSYAFDSTNRVVGDEVEGDFSVIVVRRPPAPGGKTRARDDATEPRK
jgi:uncharacterized protein (TIGR02246 family)